MANKLILTSAALVFGALTAAVRADEAKPISYYAQVLPIFKRSCQGCHHPGKLKGDLDLTTRESMLKGGKGGPAVIAGDPAKSLLIQQISGAEPEMPQKGDPLGKDEVALIEQWVREGAQDDTPAIAKNRFKLSAPPVYRAPPVLSAIVYAPDGQHLAVSGYHEVLVHRADGSGLVARLVGESPRIESIAFSPDGKQLAASGGAPALFGQVQVWDWAASNQLFSVKVTPDTVYGLSFSPDGERLLFGGADNVVRVISAKDGQALLKFENHSDWIFGTTFTVDGKRFVSGSRDRALKMVDAKSGQFIDDINKLLEGVLCLSRHPTQDTIAYGGDLGTPRIYRISDNQGRTAANNDVNLVREFERQPGPVRAIAFSPDAKWIAIGGGFPEVRVYQVTDGTRVGTLKGHAGAIFSLAFRPGTTELAAAGFDGTVRIYEAGKSELVRSFVPVPIGQPEKLAQF